LGSALSAIMSSDFTRFIIFFQYTCSFLYSKPLLREQPVIVLYA
jgi:hypothetical protein